MEFLSNETKDKLPTSALMSVSHFMTIHTLLVEIGGSRGKVRVLPQSKDHEYPIYKPTNTDNTIPYFKQLA